MKAVIETGGKQYLVEEGTVLYVEKLDVEAGKDVTFDKVLMVNGKAGSPYVKGAKVVGEVVKHDKTKKVIIYKLWLINYLLFFITNCFGISFAIWKFL